MELTSDSSVSAPLGLMQHSSSSDGCSSVGNGGVGCIVHTVTKFDTLAGVAIKYGVEVADVKRMNGLTTDLQMFARKSLQIPSPGRHPPSPVMTNGYHTQGQPSSQMTPPSHKYSDSFSPIGPLKLSSSPQRNISSSISSLREYYGLPLSDRKGAREGFEMTQTNTPLGLHRKSKSEANGLSKIYKTGSVPVPNKKGAPGSDKSIEKLVRRRKSEVDLNNRTPEDLIANHTITEPEPGAPNMVPLGSKDSSVAPAISGVRKSSSAPTFLPSETNNNSNTSPTPSSIWPISLLNFTADLQAMSIAAIASPLFDGLPKPTSGRKNKAARD
ncbi:putative LysM domain-containing protein [Helianthus debilis subsp. tardiflorus]